jgi:hypothetical protein
MKPWLRLTLPLIGLALVCLLLSLPQPAGLNHSLQVVRSGPRLDQGREPASGSLTAEVVRRMQFDPAHAGPLTSLELDCAWTATDIGPPGQETHGSRQSMRPWRVASQGRQLKVTMDPPSSTKFLTQPTEFEESEFCNSL